MCLKRDVIAAPSTAPLPFRLKAVRIRYSAIPLAFTDYVSVFSGNDHCDDNLTYTIFRVSQFYNNYKHQSQVFLKNENWDQSGDGVGRLDFSGSSCRCFRKTT